MDSSVQEPARLAEHQQLQAQIPRDDIDDLHVTPTKRRRRRSSILSTIATSPKRLRKAQRISLLDLPPEVLHMLCEDYLDTVTRTCLGLTCKTLFNITEHFYPWQVNLHMRTKGHPKLCLGHLLTDWMAPKYSFDHSWGKFLRKKHYVHDEKNVEAKWRTKEQWNRIRLQVDKYGAAVAYNTDLRGF